MPDVPLYHGLTRRNADLAAPLKATLEGTSGRIAEIIQTRVAVCFPNSSPDPCCAFGHSGANEGSLCVRW